MVVEAYVRPTMLAGEYASELQGPVLNDLLQPLVIQYCGAKPCNSLHLHHRVSHPATYQIHPNSLI